MHIPNLSIIIATCLLPAVWADCYNAGQTWGSTQNKIKAKDSINGACDMMKGLYSYKQVKTWCVPGLSGDQPIFTFEIRKEGGPANLTAEDCRVRLFNEIDGCERGGKSKHGDFVYESQPNKGSCT